MNPTLTALAAPLVALLTVIIGGGGVLTWGRSARLRTAVTNAKEMNQALPEDSTERHNMETLARARARQLLSEQVKAARAQAFWLRWGVFLVIAGLYFMGAAMVLQTEHNKAETLQRALVGLGGITVGGVLWGITSYKARGRRRKALDPSGPMAGVLDPQEEL